MHVLEIQETYQDEKMQENLNRMDEILFEDLCFFSASVLEDNANAAVIRQDVLSNLEIVKNLFSQGENSFEQNLNEPNKILCVTFDVLTDVAQQNITPNLKYANTMLTVMSHFWKKTGRTDEFLLASSLRFCSGFCSKFCDKFYSTEYDTVMPIEVHDFEMQISLLTREILKIWAHFDSHYLKSKDFLTSSIGFMKSLKSMRNVIEPVLSSDLDEDNYCSLDYSMFNVFLDGILNVSANVKLQEDGASNNLNAEVITDLVEIFNCVIERMGLEKKSPQIACTCPDICLAA